MVLRSVNRRALCSQNENSYRIREQRVSVSQESMAPVSQSTIRTAHVNFMEISQIERLLVIILFLTNVSREVSERLSASFHKPSRAKLK